jgi:EAL and modified HD-GYP domain-containing signal transduction protein
MSTPTSAPTAAFVTRQPILDSNGRVFGYELLHREKDGTADGGARGLTDVVLDMGLDTLTQGKPAFLNFSRDLLLSDAGTLLPPKKSVIQLRRGIEVDDAVVSACQALHGAGYRLALDFVSDPEGERLLPFVKFVKIDVRSMSPGAAAALVKRLSGTGELKAIAEKVETAEAFAAAKAAEFTLFQGYYFCQPTNLQTSALPGRRLAYLQLLSALRQPDVGVRQIEELVKHDVSLSYRVLKCVNSAAYGLRSEVTSIKQALIMIGIEPIRKWVSVWSIAGLNTEGPSELVSVSLLRARCCELLGQKLSGGRTGDSELFLLGLCSLLDAILNRPLADALADLPLSSEVRAALMGEENIARSVLDVVVAYESGNWDAALEKGRNLGLPEDAAATAYADALLWARELSRAAA